MGDELMRCAGNYWVLFFRPLPEAGERFALALVFEDGKGQATLQYDSAFAKVAKIYPEVDLQGLAFYLESLKADLNSSSPIQSVLNSYGPQIAASAARRIAVPVSQQVIKMLMDRYIYPSKARSKRSQRRDDKIAKEIEAFVRRSVESELDVRTDVGPREILGRPVTGAGKVALAIPSQSGWTLVDGVDLNQLTPRDAVNRADEISRTFWNYNRVAAGSGTRIRRVGVVLNGTSHLAPKTHEAHDYALHRFQVDSDLAIDTASTDSGERLRELLTDANSQ